MNWTERIEKPLPTPKTKPASVAVIGAGIAGLTTAYRLAQQGFKVTLFEASDRAGGRIMTNRESFSPQQQYCEMGGEWIDSTHESLMKLARELGLDIQDVAPKRKGKELYYIGGRFYTLQDFVDQQGGGAFMPLAHRIGKDRKLSRPLTSHAAAIDALSIDEYLTKAGPQTSTPDWVTGGIRLAYKGQYGMEPSQMSALQLINHIGVGSKMPFSVYGYKQDESRRIKGGNGLLIEKLTAKLHELGVEIKTGWHLDKLSYRTTNPNAVYTEFTHHDKHKTLHFDYVVSALPFSKLRDVNGLDDLSKRGLISDEKLRAIRELGYGNIVKVMLGLKGRPWEHSTRLPCPSDGSFHSDNPYLQNGWVTSIGQKGSEEENILTVLVAGNEALSRIDNLEARIRLAYSEMLGLPEEEIFNHRHAEHNWSNHPFSKGSYSYFKPGQYTQFRTITGTPEMHGRLGFVGEHTDPDLYGYMEGAVRSGEREAKRILEHQKTRAPAAVSR